VTPLVAAPAAATRGLNPASTGRLDGEPGTRPGIADSRSMTRTSISSYDDHRPYDRNDAASGENGLSADVFAHARNRRLSAAERRALREESLLLPKAGESPAVRMPRTEQPRMAIYQRISRSDERSVSLQRQFNECIAFVRARGGTIDETTDVYADEGVSAAGGKLRPGMETLMRRVMAGRYDGIVAWELPRILRNKLESFNFRKIMMEAGCELHVVCAPALSLYGPTSILFDTLVDVAVAEIDLMRERAQSFHAFLRPQGVALGAPVFGMKAVVSDVLVPGRKAPVKRLQPDHEPRPELGGLSRAALTSSAAEAILSGKSETRIAKEWNTAGYPSPRGGWWYAPTIRSMMKSPSLAGFAHREGLVLDVNYDAVPAGHEHKAELLRVNQPLLSEKTWFAVRDTIAGRRKGRRAWTESLLRGLIECGRCDYRVISHGQSYTCGRNWKIGFGCEGNGIIKAKAEAVLVKAALEVLRDPQRRLQASAVRAPSRRDRIAELEAERVRLIDRLTNLEDLLLESDPRDEDAKRRFRERRIKMVDQLEALATEVAELQEKSAKRHSDALAAAADVDAAWAALPNHRRNSVLHELIDHVVLRPGGGKGTKFDPTRLEIHWAAD
jgi:site-specific DNA recombinase